MGAGKLSKNIILNVGGVENINTVTHCVTRLRFVLKDKEKVNKDAIDKMEGVTDSLYSGGQYQIIIGQDVADVYDDIINNYELSSNRKERASTGPENKKKGVLERV